jgi:carbamoyl-phosphate synthase large subunit
MAGTSLKDQGFEKEIVPRQYHVKEAVFPFNKFPGIDPILGPEMKSTGEVMGVGTSFAEAYRKAQLGANDEIPESGCAFISVREVDKPRLLPIVKAYKELGFDLVATRGTADAIKAAGIDVKVVKKVREGRPHIVDMIKNGEISLILNTTEGRAAIADSSEIRSSAEAKGVYYTTTIAGGEAVAMALTSGHEDKVHRLQDLHKELSL